MPSVLSYDLCHGRVDWLVLFEQTSPRRPLGSEGNLASILSSFFFFFGLVLHRVQFMMSM